MKFQIIPVTPFEQNCSLIWCEQSREAAFIDPGGDLDKLMAAVNQQQVTLTKIFLTHGHMDHVGATEQLQRQYNLPVEGPHLGDKFWIDALDRQAAMMGFEPVETFTPDRWLAEADRLTLGHVELEVRHCPGHTPGHVVFFHRDSATAFVGDVLFRGAIGRTDFPQGNYDDLIASIRQKLWPLGDDVRFVPGHGPMSTFGAERRDNPFVADTRFG